MSHWWRAYDETVDHPKLLLLSDKQHRAWFNLMCVASAHGGVLPDIKVVAVKLRMSPAKVAAVISELKEAVLFDETETGLKPHNWDGRQYKSDVSTDRVKRFRNAKRNVSVTPPETDTEAETERKKENAPNGARSIEPKADQSGPEFELYRRGKEVLGPSAGGMIKNLLKAKENKIPLARAAIETAATKQDAREYIMGCIRGQEIQRSGWDPRL